MVNVQVGLSARRVRRERRGLDCLAPVLCWSAPASAAAASSTPTGAAILPTTAPARRRPSWLMFVLEARAYTHTHTHIHTHTHTHTHPHTLTHILCSASQLDGSMAVLSQAAMRGLAGTLWRTTRPLLAASPAWAKRAVERGFVELGLLVLNAPSEGIIVIAGGQPKSLSLSLPLFLSLSLPLCFFLSLVSSVAPYLGTYFVVYCIVSPRRRYAMRCYAMLCVHDAQVAACGRWARMPTVRMAAVARPR